MPETPQASPAFRNLITQQRKRKQTKKTHFFICGAPDLRHLKDPTPLGKDYISFLVFKSNTKVIYPLLPTHPHLIEHSLSSQDIVSFLRVFFCIFQGPLGLSRSRESHHQNHLQVNRTRNTNKKKTNLRIIFTKPNLRTSSPAPSWAKLEQKGEKHEHLCSAPSLAYLTLLYGLGRDCSAHALLNRHCMDEHKFFWWWEEGLLLLTKI